MRSQYDWGYIAFNEQGEPNYHFYIKDHAGNVRVVVNQAKQTKQKNDYYPFGALVGAMTGVNYQQYRYGTKELVRLFGLDMYDSQARWYDAATARFTTMDPLMEKYYHISPYSYCLNNPVNFVDPDGKEPDEYEAALMAAYAYKDKKSKDYIKILNERNWYVSNFKTSIKMNCTGFFGTGLQSMLFERTIDGKTEYAYAYAGTDKTSLKDIYADFTQLFGLSIQYTQAIRNARKLSEEVGDKELTFVGHSLGGGEAAAASMATGRTAITFNPANVSHKTVLYNLLWKGSGKIKNYIMVNKKVKIPGINKSIITGGDFVTIAQCGGLFLPGEINEVPSQDRFTHTINDFIKAFKKNDKP